MGIPKHSILLITSLFVSNQTFCMQTNEMTLMSILIHLEHERALCIETKKR